MIVIVATVAGLVGLLSFHTTPAHLTLGGLPGAASATSPRRRRRWPTGPPAPTTAPTTAPGGPAATTRTGADHRTTAPATSRTATGDSVNYN